MNLLRSALLLVLVLGTIAACAPGARTGPAAGGPAPENVGELPALERTAWEAWHLMEIGRLRTGAYSTNVLVDLPLPQGVRWTVQEFDETDYSLSVTGGDDAGPGFLVEPAGVRPAG